MSSTKLEVHDVLHCHQRRYEPQPQVKYTENFVKFGSVVFKTLDWTDMLTEILHTPPAGN